MSQKETMKRSAQFWAEVIEQGQMSQQILQQIHDLSETVQQLQQEKITLQQQLADSIESQATSQTALLKLNQRLMALEQQMQQAQELSQQHSNLNSVVQQIQTIEAQMIQHDRQLSQHNQQLERLHQTYSSLQQSLNNFAQQLNEWDVDAIPPTVMDQLNRFYQWMEALNLKVSTLQANLPSDLNLNDFITQTKALQQNLQDLASNLHTISATFTTPEPRSPN